MENQILASIKDDLQKAVSTKDHPFRYFTLATTGQNHTARLRTVVLRNFDEEGFVITIYTDKRSKKVLQLKENPNVSALFFDPEWLTQLRIEGVAHLEEDEKKLSKTWNTISIKARRDYTTLQDPDTEIPNPDYIKHLEGHHYFAVLHIQVYKVEYLRLKRPNHIRIGFTKENGKWEGSFLVP